MIQRLNAELEIASSILGARPSLVVSRGLNKNNSEMKVLPLPREELDASRGSYNRPHKAPSQTVGVKIVSKISTLVLKKVLFLPSPPCFRFTSHFSVVVPFGSVTTR